MTNFEWLDEKGKLPEFLEDIYVNGVHYTLEKWKIKPMKTTKSYIKDIALWLSSERKENKDEEIV